MLYVAGRAADLGDGLAQAREAVASGAALAKLEEWVAAQAGGVEQRTAGEARLVVRCALEAGLPVPAPVRRAPAERRAGARLPGTY